MQIPKLKILLSALILMVNSPVFADVFFGSPLDISSYSVQCKQKVFALLGGVVETDTNQQTSSVSEGPVCAARSITEIHYQKLLTITKASEQDASFDAALNQALTGTGAICGYTNYYAQALNKATNSLKSNHLYFFNPLSSPTRAHMDWKKNWERAICPAAESPGEHCYIPKSGRSHEALQSLYGPLYSSECASGLQIAQYTTADELFGKQAIEQRFAREEFFVGDWPDVEAADSIAANDDSDQRKQDATSTGKHLQHLVTDRHGTNYAQLGYKALIGVPGAIKSFARLDLIVDKNNQNENFVIVDSTPAAAAALLAKGQIIKSAGPGGRDLVIRGLLAYRTELQKVVSLAQSLTRQDLWTLRTYAEHNQLGRLLDPDSREAHVMDSKDAVEIARILNDPFLQQTKVYVHPLGDKSFSWHILRLAMLNPKAPFQIIFFSESAHGEIFDRWLKWQLDSCTDEQK